MTIKDLIYMVEGYRAKYPWLLTQVTEDTIKGIQELKETHNIDATDELYSILEQKIQIEIKVDALVKIGVPHDEALAIAQKEVLDKFL